MNQVYIGKYEFKGIGDWENVGFVKDKLMIYNENTAILDIYDYKVQYQ